MSESGKGLTERTLGFAFGIAGAVLVAISALVRFVGGFVDAGLGHLSGAVDAWGGAFVFLVLAGVLGLFAYLGHRRWSARPMSSGVVLVVVSVVSWFALDVSGSILALVGVFLVFVGGLLYLLTGLELPRARLATA
ncbi:MAG: hypothetical protein L3K15_06115 [Thermoplasmata archaeon]|nr:hypothetical protein [Thermoplasmata archaeon]